MQTLSKGITAESIKQAIGFIAEHRNRKRLLSTKGKLCISDPLLLVLAQ